MMTNMRDIHNLLLLSFFRCVMNQQQKTWLYERNRNCCDMRNYSMEQLEYVRFQDQSVIQSKARSRIHCAVLCAEREGCVSSSYDRQRGHCELQTGHPTNISRCGINNSATCYDLVRSFCIANRCRQIQMPCV